MDTRAYLLGFVFGFLLVSDFVQAQQQTVQCFRNTCNNGMCRWGSKGFSCRCNAGFENPPENRTTCVDYNECQFKSICPNGVCVNFEGTYECKCDHGFKQTSNRKGCIFDPYAPFTNTWAFNRFLKSVGYSQPEAYLLPPSAVKSSEVKTKNAPVQDSRTYTSGNEYLASFTPMQVPLINQNTNQYSQTSKQIDTSYMMPQSPALSPVLQPNPVSNQYVNAPSQTGSYPPYTPIQSSASLYNQHYNPMSTKTYETKLSVQAPIMAPQISPIQNPSKETVTTAAQPITTTLPPIDTEAPEISEGVTAPPSPEGPASPSSVQSGPPVPNYVEHISVLASPTSQVAGGKPAHHSDLQTGNGGPVGAPPQSTVNNIPVLPDYSSQYDSQYHQNTAPKYLQSQFYSYNQPSFRPSQTYPDHSTYQETDYYPQYSSLLPAMPSTHHVQQQQQSNYYNPNNGSPYQMPQDYYNQPHYGSYQPYSPYKQGSLVVQDPYFVGNTKQIPPAMSAPSYRLDTKDSASAGTPSAGNGVQLGSHSTGNGVHTSSSTTGNKAYVENVTTQTKHSLPTTSSQTTTNVPITTSTTSGMTASQTTFTSAPSADDTTSTTNPVTSTKNGPSTTEYPSSADSLKSTTSSTITSTTTSTTTTTPTSSSILSFTIGPPPETWVKQTGPNLQISLGLDLSSTSKTSSHQAMSDTNQAPFLSANAQVTGTNEPNIIPPSSVINQDHIVPSETAMQEIHHGTILSTGLHQTQGIPTDTYMPGINQSPVMSLEPPIPDNNLSAKNPLEFPVPNINQIPDFPQEPPAQGSKQMPILTSEYTSPAVGISQESPQIRINQVHKPQTALPGSNHASVYRPDIGSHPTGNAGSTYPTENVIPSIYNGYNRYMQSPYPYEDNQYRSNTNAKSDKVQQYPSSSHYIANEPNTVSSQYASMHNDMLSPLKYSTYGKTENLSPNALFMSGYQSANLQQNPKSPNYQSSSFQQNSQKPNYQSSSIQQNPRSSSYQSNNIQPHPQSPIYKISNSQQSPASSYTHSHQEPSPYYKEVHSSQNQSPTYYHSTYTTGQYEHPEPVLFPPYHTPHLGYDSKVWSSQAVSSSNSPSLTSTNAIQTYPRGYTPTIQGYDSWKTADTTNANQDSTGYSSHDASADLLLAFFMSEFM